MIDSRLDGSWHFIPSHEIGALARADRDLFVASMFYAQVRPDQPVNCEYGGVIASERIAKVAFGEIAGPDVDGVGRYRVLLFSEFVGQRPCTCKVVDDV